MTRSISRTLEYSYNDFCIAQMARGMNKLGDAEKYMGTSNHWTNLFDASQTSKLRTGVDTGFVGFFQPKYLNLSWGLQDPLACSNIDDYTGLACSLQNTAQETYESSVWEYSL